MDREKTRKRFMKYYSTLKADKKKELVECLYKTLTDKFVKSFDKVLKDYEERKTSEVSNKRN